MAEEKKSSSGIVPAVIIVVLAILAGVYGWMKTGDVLATFLMPFGVVAIGIVFWLIARNIRLKYQQA